ncbi:phospholipid/cholesterol/gamma-HCH transport system substrate-binding protein [Crossiella equi]|uniref:Phospholipid/cholesterol/gamma-HCH transport system substrate-binding protein n=1 Tax=Crossiella equi TaxID=130796 RepID=A0ABS5AHS2_9PSEU|nr:MlaD family protein [Crossiella equi]MBP2476116.1 phospholipid/cholesterol/gamma-HCH transport system substrate-binding protein [Crossiella equi]
MRGLTAPLVKFSVFVLVTVLATTLLAITIANSSLGESTAYQARFTDVTSLNEGDDVRIAGVKVGQVEEISIADRRLAQVRFSVDPQRKLPASVTATVKYRNLVGQRYIALEQGAGATGTLPPGGVIPLERTQPALDLTALFNGFKPLFQALNPDDVNKLSYEIVQVLQGEGGTITSLLAHTASLTTTIAQKDKVVGEVVDNLNSVLGSVNERDTQLTGLVTQLQQLVSGLSQDRQPIGEAITALGTLTNTTAGLLDGARDPLRKDIDALGKLAKNLGDGNDIVEGVLQRMPKKLETITRTATYGSWFNFFLCEASGQVTVPIINKPVEIPVLPATQPRCKS